MKKFTNHIYYMDNNPETDQPYVYLIHGSKFNLQIDAGNSPENYHKFLSEVKDLGLNPPKLLAITHWHWDHTFGMVGCSVPMIASVKTNEYLKKVKNWKWTEEAMHDRLKTGEDIQFCYDCIHKQYLD
ncbi:MAG: MBL fold metallo-hydrolase, partial [Solobacterium sp.]|nr:MBL fold metallo-hydrolase [Solobacterium sp.]